MSIVDIDKYLGKDQINRCYDVFIFDENEEINTAWYDEGQLYIEIIIYNDPEDPDNYPEFTVYEPDLSGVEGLNKLNYILFGEGEY